jgi:pyruvate,water dikinase
VARWSEDPTHLLGVISNYLQLTDDALAPDVQFERGAREAAATTTELLARVGGPRRRVLRFFMGRARALMGSRELPKYTLIRLLFTPLREMLRPVGVELAAAGRIASPEDVYFLSLAEARAAEAGSDMHATVAANRAGYERELRRRHIPRVLLSDGTDAEIALVETVEGDLRGSPASPGVARGRARVIHSPRGARLEPGEILVAPSTDPGWTPLFLTAGGLVMEMGGMMSHGAVVAREYGIPAVVGVAGATDRVVTGDTITVDGSAGVVAVAADGAEPADAGHHPLR